MKKLVDVNEDVLAGRTLGAVEEIWYSSKDGLKVQGWIVKPANFQPGKKYPLVLLIHGGPWSMYDVGFNWSFQNFAANGYAVLYTNPRGSTGYGQDFVNGIQFSYPGKDYDDLMAGVDAAVGKGYVDERNLFVCGGSGGGLLTAWIVGHTNRFAAAVAMRPVIDWVSFVGVTDSGGWYRQFEKLPWEDPSDHLKRSPLTYVGNVTTPTMVMTGEADLRTPIGQSEEFYKALKMQKKETLLVRMPDEFHGWRRPSHRLMQQLYLLAWFDKHKRPSGTATAVARRCRSRRTARCCPLIGTAARPQLARNASKRGGRRLRIPERGVHFDDHLHRRVPQQPGGALKHVRSAPSASTRIQSGRNPCAAQYSSSVTTGTRTGTPAGLSSDSAPRGGSSRSCRPRETDRRCRPRPRPPPVRSSPDPSCGSSATFASSTARAVGLGSKAMTRPPGAVHSAICIA